MRGVKKTLVSRLIAGLGILALSGMAAVQAASECKGLPQADCEAKAECKWIKGYTRQDGKEVAGYCRSVAKKADEAAAPGSTTQPAAGSAPKPAQ